MAERYLGEGDETGLVLGGLLDELDTKVNGAVDVEVDACPILVADGHRPIRGMSLEQCEVQGGGRERRQRVSSVLLFSQQIKRHSP